MGWQETQERAGSGLAGNQEVSGDPMGDDAERSLLVAQGQERIPVLRGDRVIHLHRTRVRMFRERLGIRVDLVYLLLGQVKPGLEVGTAKQNHEWDLSHT